MREEKNIMVNTFEIFDAIDHAISVNSEWFERALNTIRIGGICFQEPVRFKAEEFCEQFLNELFTKYTKEDVITRAEFVFKLHYAEKYLTVKQLEIRELVIEAMMGNRMWMVEKLALINHVGKFCNDEDDIVIEFTNRFFEKFMSDVVREYGGKDTYRVTCILFKRAYSRFKNAHQRVH